MENWKYRGNKSSEESDEAKSTLIEYPFSVSIQRKGAHYTTGALLNKWWIITVAAEFYNVRDSLKLFRARLGSVDCKRGGTVVPLKQIEFHPYYIYGKPNFDVALLRMAYFIDFSDFIRPIALSALKGKVVKGSVLPKTANERIKYNSMRVSTQRLIPQHKCMKIIKDLNEMLNESTLCLKPVISHHSVCMPDPGAPVVAEDGLWGITSSWISPKCPQQPAPTVFTRLSSVSVRSWLNTVLHNLG
ncbi:unnamed protein product [Arctia plantaginis]|uniref:Peptidase S1 domain-containing protein n=1 Tax=Arctia plantaginis TaxID=874455 RepID=A0A8S1AE30_ARCPL|nr:unnamed protein product [Arctia plantaginis]